MIHSKLLIAGTLVILACAPDDGADSTSTTDAAATTSAAATAQEDLADVRDYRLTMRKIDQFHEAQRNMFRAPADMTPAEREGVNMSGDGNLDEMVENIESNRTINSAIRDAGLSAREYTMVTISLMTSAMAGSILQMRPDDNQDSLAREMNANMENIRFVRENQDEIARKQKEIADEVARLQADEP